jgi:hypothetical protein
VEASSGQRHTRQEVSRAQAGENLPVPRPRHHHIPNAPGQSQLYGLNSIRCHNDQCTKCLDKFRAHFDDHYRMIKSLSQRLEGVCKDLPYWSGSSAPVHHHEPLFTFHLPMLCLSFNQRRLTTVTLFTAVIVILLAIYVVAFAPSLITL